MSEPLVIVGNGMAALRLVEELGRRALGRYAIAVIGDEPQLAYNRVLLSSVLARDVSRERHRIALRRLVARPRRHVALRPSRDRDRYGNPPREARSGATLPFSRLVLATGSRAIRLRIPGMNCRG